MMSKVVISVVSVLLVVGVAIGVVTMVNRNHAEANPLATAGKSVQVMCAPASDKQACRQTLESVKSDDPKDLVKALVQAAQEAVKSAHNFTSGQTEKLGKEEPETKKVALDYCKKVLDYAADDLQSFMDAVGNDVQNLNDKFYDLKQWLTSVWVYQRDCLDDIQEEDLAKTMEGGITDARKFTGNAIDVLDNLSNILTGFGVKFNFSSIASAVSTSGSRRLLNVQDGFPTWMSAADRKLLGRGQGGVNHANIKPNVVVAKDGSGQFKTISDAIKAYPAGQKGRYIIYVKAGVYREMVVIPKKKDNIFIYGDGPRKTIITNNKSYVFSKLTTSLTATVQVEAMGFMMKWVGVQNTAGPEGHQAVALRINGDRAVVFNCRLDGYQDTLYVDSGRQYYRNCVISGTVDFIFGTSNTIIQNSLIIVRKGNSGQYNTVTAEGNDRGASLGTGIVIQNCRIVPDMALSAAKATVKSYLGRPWKAFSTTLVMESEIGDFLNPEGWHIWDGKNFHQTCYYREFNNRGPGAKTNMRAKWTKVVTSKREIEKFTVANFLKPLDWLQTAGVPFLLGFKY